MKKAIYFLIAAFWLLACNNDSQKQRENSASEKPKVDYYGQGAEISAIAQAELMKSVKSALEEGGPTHAIKYCNVHATPLTDSLSNAFDCRIERVSLKNRNPGNAVEGREEILLMNNMLERSLEGKGLNDTLLAMDGEVVYYRPIFLGMEACLNCHGIVGEEIANETYAVISELYPEDKATNYRLGEFRGAWKVRFPMNVEE